MHENPTYRIVRKADYQRPSKKGEKPVCERDHYDFKYTVKLTAYVSVINNEALFDLVEKGLVIVGKNAAGLITYRSVFRH